MTTRLVILYHTAAAYAHAAREAVRWLLTERRLARRFKREPELFLKAFILRRVGAWRP